MFAQKEVTIIGGGLAGCEAAWQIAEKGFKVKLFEMRPFVSTGAHLTDKLAELVCSNSFGSNVFDRSSGLLKAELRKLGSLLVLCAEEKKVPAGGALAVDREGFSKLVSEKIEQHPNIELIREEVIKIPSGVTIIASGPLTSPSLSDSIKQFTGTGNLFFYDAIAPIIAGETIDFNKAFRGNRYGKGDTLTGDYVNCPLTKDEYFHLVQELITAETISLRGFENQVTGGVTAGPQEYFEGCLPIEILARRDQKALAFGPLRPVGLKNPMNNDHPYAVVQLRQDDLAQSLYSLVGFQTNINLEAQKRVVHQIPGLEHAEIIRYGQMHRNTFIYSPDVIHPSLQSKSCPNIFFAGQIIGVEGYVGNIGTGLLAGLNASRFLEGKEPAVFPRMTMLGSLCYYVTHTPRESFQPMKANFGLLPSLQDPRPSGRRARGLVYAERAMKELEMYIDNLD